MELNDLIENLKELRDINEKIPIQNIFTDKL